MSPADFSIKAKIIPEIDAAMLKTQAKGLGLGGAAVMGGIAGAAAGGVIGIISQILSQFKPLMSIVKAISRILIEFLRPIADMVMIMLMPILMILKPILMVFKTLMAPFRALAMRLGAAAGAAFAAGETAEGALLMTAALDAMAEGIVFAMALILAQVIDMMTGWDLTGRVLGHLDEVKEDINKILELDTKDLIKEIKKQADKGLSAAVTVVQWSVMGILTPFIEKMSEFAEDGAKAIGNAISRWRAAFESALGGTMKGGEPTVLAGAIGLVPKPVYNVLVSKMFPETKGLPLEEL